MLICVSKEVYLWFNALLQAEKMAEKLRSSQEAGATEGPKVAEAELPEKV